MTKILVTVFVMMSVTISMGSLVARSSGASLVRKDADGGRAQLRGAYAPAMGDARILMAAHCNGSFEYEEIGRALEFRCSTLGAQLVTAADELSLRIGTR